jgi:hypothetical protein
MYYLSILKTYVILQSTKFNQGPPAEVTLLCKYDGSGGALGLYPTGSRPVSNLGRFVPILTFFPLIYALSSCNARTVV